MRFLNWLFRTTPATKLNPAQPVSPDDTAYVHWVCCDDDDSCAECKSRGKQCWIPELVKMEGPPNRACTSKEGCRCELAYIPWASGEAPELVELMRRSGGWTTSEQIAEHERVKQAPLRERRERQRLASQKAHAASELKRDHRQQAIALYRESIQILREVVQSATEGWEWRDFPYLYDRLTLLLEREGNIREALAEIEAYLGLPCGGKGSKRDRATIDKRRIRLLMKLQSHQGNDGKT